MDKSSDWLTFASRNRVFLAIVIAIVVLSIAWLQDGCLLPPPFPGPQAVTTEDAAVYEALLADTAKDARFSIPYVPGRSNLILVNGSIVDRSYVTPGNEGDVAVAPVNPDLDSRWDWMKTSLIERNRTRIDIPKFASTLPLIFAKETDFSSGDSADTDIHLSLPAYNVDHTTALMYFYWKNQTAMGGGYCVLHRTGTEWIVDDSLSALKGPIASTSQRSLPGS